jgi:murein DD-endopeptidase MepM/ murein hydrolase activator NlpD
MLKIYPLTLQKSHNKVGTPASSKKNILWYDGHSGYDYPADFGIGIQAATKGILCIATSNTVSGGGKVWRKQNKCPYGNDTVVNRSLGGTNPATSWGRWHMFYILHPGDNYSTWYLHVSSLDPSVMNKILSNGYAEVEKGQSVAKVGHWGLGDDRYGNKPDKGPNHLHFEVRSGNHTLVDPYGNGVQNILWEISPP